jgi:hypothetical protein
LVRDKQGAYRPAGGGRPVLLDEGNSLSIKSMEHGPKAIVELAMAKGWTAINLTGNKRTQEAIWLEASFAGLQVQGYEPSKAAKIKLAEMFAQEQQNIEIVNKSVADGSYNGKILDVKNGIVVQKIGRDPDVVARHDISKLSRVPDKNEVCSIAYRGGRGEVSSKEIKRGIDL